MPVIDQYSKLVEQALLAAKEFDIKEVRQLENIHSSLFNKEQYPFIIKGLQESSDFQLPLSETQTENFRQYLEVYKFTDQANKKYLVTIYDSDALEQDPQLIDIIPL